MNLQDALLTYKKVSRDVEKNSKDWVCYYKKGTGPYFNLVDCDYFVICEDGVENFSTSLDLYPADILAEDWQILSV